MTAQEAILSYPALKGISLNLLQKFAIDRDLSLEAVYSASLKQTVELTVADIYKEAALTPEFRESELSEKYSAEYLNLRADQIYSRYGELTSVKNNIIHGW